MTTFTPGTAKYYMEVELVDAGLNVTRRSYDLRGATMADAVTNASALITDLAAITNAFIQGYRVGEFLPNTEARSFTTDVNVEEEALMNIQLATSPVKTASITVPAPVDAAFVGAPGSANYNVLDVEATVVTDYVGNFLSGGTAFISDGESAADNNPNKGRRIHRKSRRG